jgi:hypothetical protein
MKEFARIIRRKWESARGSIVMDLRIENVVSDSAE